MGIDGMEARRILENWAGLARIFQNPGVGKWKLVENQRIFSTTNRQRPETDANCLLWSLLSHNLSISNSLYLYK